MLAAGWDVDPEDIISFKLITGEDVAGPTSVIVQAQKSVLAEMSPVFNAMFFGSLREKDEVEIVDSTPEAFDHMIRYIYHRDFDESFPTSNKATVAQTLYLAQKYFLERLDSECRKILFNNLTEAGELAKIDIFEFVTKENISDMLTYAVQFDEYEMTKICTAILATSIINIWEIPLTECIWKTILEQNIDKIKPLHLFKRLNKWARMKCREQGRKDTARNCRRVVGDELLFRVPFLKMTEEDIKHSVADSGLLTEEEVSAILAAKTGEAGDPPFLVVPECLTRVTKHSFNALRDGTLHITVTPNADVLLKTMDCEFYKPPDDAINGIWFKKKLFIYIKGDMRTEVVTSVDLSPLRRVDEDREIFSLVRPLYLKKGESYILRIRADMSPQHQNGVIIGRSADIDFGNPKVRMEYSGLLDHTDTGDLRVIGQSYAATQRDSRWYYEPRISKTGIRRLCLVRCERSCLSKASNSLVSGLEALNIL